MKSTDASKPLEQAVKELIPAKGDILVSVLFLPVALMFQNLANKMFNPDLTEPGMFSSVVKLAFIFYACIVEVLAVSLVVLAWARASRYRMTTAGLCILAFMVTITLMGYPNNSIAFRIAFALSSLATFAAFYIFDWGKFELNPHWAAFLFFISSFLHIQFFVP